MEDEKKEPAVLIVKAYDFVLSLLPKGPPIVMARQVKPASERVVRRMRKARGEPWPLQELGAQERTRTSTPLRELGPEPSASASSATWAVTNYHCPIAVAMLSMPRAGLTTCFFGVVRTVRGSGWVRCLACSPICYRRRF